MKKWLNDYPILVTLCVFLMLQETSNQAITIPKFKQVDLFRKVLDEML